VILEVATPDLRTAPHLARQVKTIHPTVPVWVVGQHPSYSAAPFLDEGSSIDGCINGEIFSSVVPIAEHRPAAEIPGAVVSTDGSLTVTPPVRSPTPDEMPPLEPNGLSVDEYGLLSVHMPSFSRQRWGFLLTSWGCPGECLFCSQTLRKSFDRKWRAQSPERVIADMERLARDHRLRAFYLADDLVSYGRDRLLRIAEQLERKRLGLRWVFQTCSRFLDPDMLPLLKRAGCVGIKYGVESGDEELLKRIGKPLDLSRVIKLSDAIRASGIALTTYYMIGLPGETMEQMEKTYRLARRIGSEMIQVALYTPYPTSRGFEELPGRVREELLEQPERFSHYNSLRPINVSAVGDSQLLCFQRDFYLRYYFSVPQMWRYLSRRAVYTIPQGLDAALSVSTLGYLLRRRSGGGSSK